MLDIDKSYKKTLPINVVKEMASSLRVHQNMLDKFQKDASTIEGML
jgi:hypothetical protein